MEKEEVLNQSDKLIYGGMTRKELSFLYDICSNKTVLELGSMAGRSSYVIASTAKKLWCVDVWSDTLDHLVDPIQISHYKVYQPKNIFDTFIKNCGVFIDSGKLEMCRGKTVEVANSFPDNFFDIIFIDADHSYSGVSNDYASYEYKLKSKGNFVFHDYEHEVLTGISKFCNEKAYRKELQWVKRVESLAVFMKTDTYKFDGGIINE